MLQCSPQSYHGDSNSLTHLISSLLIRLISRAVVLLSVSVGIVALGGFLADSLPRVSTDTLDHWEHTGR